MKSNRKKIEEARRLLFEATKLLTEVIEMQENNISGIEDWMKQRMELWARIYLEGGIVDRKRLYEIWKDEMGRDTRGLGGFFVGKRASLVWTHDGKIMLTRYASESTEAWSGKSLREYAKELTECKSANR